MNKVYIIGHITKDLELKYYGSETDLKPYVQFSIAVNNKNKSTGEKFADFINVVAFNRKAEIISEYFSKGRKISIEGHLRTGSYIDNLNNKKYITNVILDNFDFIDKKEAIQ